MVDYAVMFFVFLCGACFGSFANVLIYRIPRNISFVRGVSHCVQCGKRVMPYDLVPILSYVVLRGKCRYCKGHISLRYPLIELLGGFFAVLAAWVFGYGAVSICLFSIFMILLTIAAIDMEHMIIPNGLVAGLVVASVLFLAVTWNNGSVGFFSRVIGFFALSVPMILLTFLIKDAFGGGDIKLIAVGGFLLGVRLVLLAGFIAVVLGGCWGVYLRYIKRNKQIVHIAFGQYICFGIFIGLLCGDIILDWYFSSLFIH